MNVERFDEMLLTTLEDGKLSRGERKSLAAWLADCNAGEHELAQLRSRAFHITRQQVEGPQGSAALEWLEEAIKLLTPRSSSRAWRQDAYFSPGQDCLRAITGQFNAVRQRADVCVFTITDNRIAQAMLDAHQRGIQLRVLTDDDKSADLGSDIGRLRDAGITVCQDRSPWHMHHKFAIFDGARVLTGSYNWTRGAAESNEENLLISDDANLVRQYQSVFDNLWCNWAGA
jgi:mitochondrial cardiolipin hydrolase